MDSFSQVFDLFFMCAGPCLIVYGLVSFRRTQEFIRRSVEVPGEVTRLERSSGSFRSGPTYAPVFCFTAADGREYTVTSDAGSSPPGFAVGDQVRVRYDPSNPEDARIHTFFQTWGSAVLSSLVGLAFASFSLFHSGLLPFHGFGNVWSSR